MIVEQPHETARLQALLAEIENAQLRRDERWLGKKYAPNGSRARNG
jgi:hypothetical protein